MRSTAPASPVSKPAKKPWLILSLALAGLAVLGGIIWWWSQAVVKDFATQAKNYQQQVKTARDSIDNEFKQKKLSIFDKEAKDVLKRGAANLESVVAKAPQEPKLLWLIPLGPLNTKQTVQQLTDVTQAYDTSIRDILATFNYADAVLAAFKPVKDLGFVLTENPKPIFNSWPEFVKDLKSIKPPDQLVDLHNKLIKSATEVQTSLTNMYAAFQAGSVSYNSLVDVANAGISANNKLFVSSINQVTTQQRDEVNTRYDKLDALLK
jgi:hypothetical protein